MSPISREDLIRAHDLAREISAEIQKALDEHRWMRVLTAKAALADEQAEIIRSHNLWAYEPNKKWLARYDALNKETLE